MVRVLRDVPLGPRTSLQIGGSAARLVWAESEADVCLALQEGDVTILGGGSNVLISDRGLPGTVLSPAIRGFSLAHAGTHVDLFAAAGELWDDVVARAVEEGLAGVECLSGIPGWVGAVPIQNVGAYGQEVADTLVSVRVVDRATGVRTELSREACGFAYRDSELKRRPRWVVLGATFRLRPGLAAPPRYAELVKALGEAPQPLDHVRRTVLALRGAKGMVLSADDPDSVSAGSFFTNPLVPEASVPAIRARADQAAPGVVMPTFDGGPGLVKLAAGWLIERAGFRKGEVRGRVGISSKHALALVNRGGGSAAEIVAFSGEIQARVREVFGVGLEPEPVFLGF